MNTCIMEPRQETAGDILLDAKVRKRRLSLEDKFMNYGIDDLLFGVALKEGSRYSIIALTERGNT